MYSSNHKSYFRKFLILTAGIFLLTYILYLHKNIKNFYDLAGIQPKTDCTSEIKQATVRGNSLSGLIEDGSDIEILLNYYSCHPIQRNEVVIYGYSGNKNPLIKIAKGIENDKFKLVKSGTGCGWNILINDKITENSKGLPYCINANGYRMLSLYESDYRGIIPKNTYLILGNVPDGTLDSTRFGLVDKSDIIGKVEY